MTSCAQPTRPQSTSIRELDWMMLSVVALCCLGLVMAVSVVGAVGKLGPLHAAKRQGVELLVAMVGFMVASITPMRVVRALCLPAFLLFAGLCYAAVFVAEGWNGAHRWIQIGSLQFQPVEGARVCLVLLTAKLLASAGDGVETFRRGLLPPALAAGFLAGGLLLQPDHGNALISCMLVAVLCLVAGVRLRQFLPFATVGIVVFVAMALRHNYVTGRLLNFLSIEPRSQVGQSMVAIASGGAFGRGLGDGWMKMGFVAEAENDFVFAVVAEELGYVGCMLVLSLYSVFGVVCYRLVCRIRDPFLRYVVCGLSFMLCMQAALNLLVVSGWAPAKGIDLPFVSTGGTSLLFCLSAVGVIGNAARTDLLESASLRSNAPGRV